MSDPLFTELRLGALRLKNRIVMAPMTRSRAAPGDMPTDLMAEYYRQRAGAGLIISEGIAPSANGIGYCRTPGIYCDEQAEAWARIVQGVHAEGGLMAAQLMHCGRIASSRNKAAGSETVAPSAVQAQGEMYTDAAGMVPFDAPRALAPDEIPAIVEEYRRAAQYAFDAGFDAVELHCTSGYLPAQFLSTGTNRREDEYGGDARQRARFPLEVLRALGSARGPERVGLRICPDNPFNDLHDENPAETFAAFLAAAAELNLAYCHVIRFPKGRVDNLALAARYFGGEGSRGNGGSGDGTQGGGENRGKGGGKGGSDSDGKGGGDGGGQGGGRDGEQSGERRGSRIIGNESYARDEAAESIAAGQLAAASFGRPFIANPDLPRRFRHDWPLAPVDHKTLYTPGPAGYVDYAPHSPEAQPESQPEA